MNGLGASVIVLVILVAVAIGLLPMIFYLLTLSRTLRQCAQHNRKMEPGQVWMVFIPIFGLVWHFIMVGHIADSLAAEYRERGLQPKEARPGYSIGLTFLILQLCGIVPLLGILASLGGLVCWIIYWVRMAEYKKELEAIPAMAGSGMYNTMHNQQTQTWQQQGPPTPPPTV